MRLLRIKTLTDIAEGDILIINGKHPDGPEIQAHTVKMVKVTERDGTEIILHKKSNLYFNLGMYLEGKSWVKQARKLVTSTKP